MADSIGTDTSSYPRPQPAPNPLDQILKVRDTAGALGDIEVGKGIQQAIQPDGTIDRNTLAQVLKGSVAGSMKAPAALSALEQLRQAGHSADIEAVRNQVSQIDYVGKLLGPLADKKEVSKDELVNTAGKAIANATKLGLTGYIPDVAKFLAQTNGDPNMTDAKRAQIVRDHHFQAQTVARQLDAELPRGEFRSTGQRDVLVPTGTQRNPAFGTSVQQEIPPTASQPGPNNQPTYRGTQPPSTGSDVQIPAQQPRATSNGQPVRLAQPGDGTAYGVPRGGAAAPVPGAPEAQRLIAEESSRQANNLTSAMNEVPATKSILNAMEEDLSKFASGPGADYSRIGKSFAVRNLPIPESLKKEGGFFDPKSIASQEQFNKFSNLVAQNQFKALGGTGTDSKLNSASSTSPNEYLSTLGNKGIIQFLKGMQDAVTAKDKAWANWQASGKGGPESFAAFSRDFNQNFDPRVFQFKYMTPAERQKTFAGMPAAERAQFAKDATRARKEGWVDYGAQQ